jgi:hypothetical protein
MLLEINPININMCVLHVTSLTNSFKDFIGKTTLPVYQSFEKGERNKYRKKEILEDYSFSCDVSKRSWNDVEGQLDDITMFIQTHNKDLLILRDNFNISDWRFDLPYYNWLINEYISQSVYLSPKLIRLLSDFNFGIEMTLYEPGEEMDISKD